MRSPLGHFAQAINVNQNGHAFRHSNAHTDSVEIAERAGMKLVSNRILEDDLSLFLFNPLRPEKPKIWEIFLAEDFCESKAPS